MSAKLPLKNDLQKEFAERAHKESNGYILPWTRGPLRKASSLDPIYQALGQVNLNYQSVRTLINNLRRDKSEKYRKYRNTLTWLQSKVLDGDYVQQGNSCGAWSLTHWKMRKEHRYYGAGDFRTSANSIYDSIKFKASDWPGAAPCPAVFNDWVTEEYASPWKIMQALGITKLKIDPAARVFAAGVSPQAQLLKGMLDLVNALRGGKPEVADGNLGALPTGSGAIILAKNPGGLHYLLLGHAKAGWEIYNSNSHKLNPTTLPACPQFNDTIDTKLKPINGVGETIEKCTFLGVFIAA
ncbi:MAG: hypothetical protein OEW48_08025 [Phycisphaerae bacterium]|nr:hypothetical protein [Phycisphaerae bacterium]